MRSTCLENFPGVCPVSWGCGIHRLLLCRGVRPPPQRVSWLWYLTIWWWGSVMLELWGMPSTPKLPLLPGPLWPKVVAADKGSIYGSNRNKPWFREFTVFAFKLCIHAKLNYRIELFWLLNCILMLNWIAWHRTVLTSKLCTYAKLNYLKYNFFDINCVLLSWLGL